MVWSIPCLAQSVSFFVPQSTFTGIAFRRGEKRLKWQGLDACLPWQWSEKREAEPPQVSGFDKMTATGASRVTIDPARVNFWAPTAFYGVIKADGDWFHFDEICHEMLEKYFQQITRFPLGAIENLVEGIEGFELGVTRNPQARRYGSLARCQQRAHRKNARKPPSWLREGGTERIQTIHEKLWNGLTGFGGEITMFHDDLFSLELQSGVALHRSSADSSLT